MQKAIPQRVRYPKWSEWTSHHALQLGFHQLADHTVVGFYSRLLSWHPYLLRLPDQARSLFRSVSWPNSLNQVYIKNTMNLTGNAPPGSQVTGRLPASSNLLQRPPDLSPDRKFLE